MTISFRAQVMAATTLLVCVTLAAVVAVGWSRILKFEVLRLDDRLCMEVRRLTSDPKYGQNIRRLENDLVAKLRLASPAQLMVRSESMAGAPEFESANWDGAINLRALTWLPAPPDAAPGASPRPEAPERHRPPRPADGRDDGPPPFPGGAGAPRGQRPAQGDCQHSSYTAQGKQWRAAILTQRSGRSLVAADLAATQTELRSAYQSALTTVLPLALALTGLGAWLLSTLTLRPVNRLRNAMRIVTQKALDKRLSVRGEGSEFRELIMAYNTMLERLEVSFNNAARFSSDAAHELKTPLTILQGRLEQALDNCAHGTDRADLAGMLDEVGRLAAITRKLLLLSQADAGYLALHATRVDMSEILGALVLDLSLATADHQITSAIDPGLVMHGDELLLKQLFNNLITNAVRYCLPAGTIEVSAHRRPAGIEVVMANTTPAISADSRAQFFDRFYRGDAAHERHIEGSGLGLSLAREIARAHGGDVSLLPTLPSEVRIRLWLPDRA